ncbi:hypothetical protein [Faecalispora jeddahensis]|uniref:hypothetical protein n=1 Tax=Faecalispora jeddahensis TaxID=1414721 RepID=UPI0004B2D9D7|nr:hypothetical protein [Faecalispora jeddahensis]
MKAHIPPRQQISNLSLKAIDEYIQQESHNMSRRLFKLVAVALNELYGFGAKRNLKLSQRVGNLIIEHQDDEIFWQHVDQFCDQMKLGYEHEDYERMEKRRKRR